MSFYALIHLQQSILSMWYTSTEFRISVVQECGEVHTSKKEQVCANLQVNVLQQ